jgi:hypothetical protein
MTGLQASVKRCPGPFIVGDVEEPAIVEERLDMNVIVIPR